jgi:hypothetical protein
MDRVRVARDRAAAADPAGYEDVYVIQDVDGHTVGEPYPYTPDGKAAARLEASRINEET